MKSQAVRERPRAIGGHQALLLDRSWSVLRRAMRQDALRVTHEYGWENEGGIVTDTESSLDSVLDATSTDLEDVKYEP